VAIDGTEGIYTVEDRDATTVSPYSGAISAFAYMPDGQRIYAVLNQDGLVSIHIRPADSNDAGDDVVLEGHTDIIWDFALSGDTLLSASRDGDVRLWSVDGARQVGLVQAAHSSADPLVLYVAESWGIDIGEDIVIDTATAGEVADEFTPVIYYAGSESPIVTPLFASGVRPFLIGASSVTPGVSAPADITVQSLLLTTPGTSWAETTDPLTVQPIYEEGLDLPGPVSVGASAENFTTGARVVVIGDADFATNNALQLTTYGNADLLVNAFDWASPSENSVQLPPPDFSQNLMDKPFSLVELRVVQILLACIVPPSLMVIGVAIWFQRRRRR
jgi:WD40 repeat protein